MEKMKPEILILDSLKIGYQSGRHNMVLLPPLNACAGKGELIAVIGKNGIGKSTLLRTMTGLQPAMGGQILYENKNLMDYSKLHLAQKIGYISTEVVRVSNMTVYDLVSLGRFPHTNWMGKIDEKNHKIIVDAMERTSISTNRNRFISELSDGERQRAMIARILAQDTGLMIMDEPTAFLDIGSKYEILHLLHILSHESKKTIIFSTHDLNIAIDQADKIWLLHNDKLIEGAPEDLMMKGAFDHLFDDSPVHFNRNEGTFSFRSQTMGSIYLEGEGISRHWTEKAIKRVGFTISETKTVPYIIVPSTNVSYWQLISDAGSRKCLSVYELVSLLIS